MTLAEDEFKDFSFLSFFGADPVLVKEGAKTDRREAVESTDIYV